MPQYFGKLPAVESPWSSIETIKSVKVSDRHVDILCGKALLRLSILADNLIRVRFAPQGQWLPRRSWAVTVDDADWELVPFQFQETEKVIEIKTEQINVRIERDPCRIYYRDNNGQSFACDAEQGIGWRTGAIAGWKKIEPGEHFYGFGERTGLLDKRSEIKTNWTIDSVDYDSLTNEMYQAIPFFIGLRPQLSYGIFLNSTFWSEFDMGAKEPGVWRMETRTQELDYYIIYGLEPAQILQTYSQLTGRMPLPPRWALGYHQCRWGYDSQAVVRQIAHEFRTRRIPCDVIHLDIDYMRGYRVFTWSPKRFPNPAKFFKDLAREGFNIVTIVDPGVKYEPEGDYAVFDEGVEKDYFVRNPDGQLFHGYVWPDKAVFPDFLRPEVRQWWGECHKILTEAGVAGIWNDMNEPSIADRPFGDRGNKIWFSLDTCQGPSDELASHAETHNIYGLMMVQACYEGLKTLRPGQRSFMLTRSGFAGIQRWSSVWMGDNQAIWEHLELSLPMLCNMGLSGVPFVGCDIGGFAGNSSAELFARWMQVGMLYPLMRAHSAMTTDRREPWVFGDRVERICREFIELRYRLLPYIYTLFQKATTTGTLILAPLLYHYPNDPKTYHLHDQVMLGPFLMAAPIYRPGVEHRAVYLPEGTWYDWWSNASYQGPTNILADAPLEIMPLYVKAGAIIPMQPVMQYVDEQVVEELTLRIYPGNGEFTLYEDDGRTFEYQQQDAWATTSYHVYQEGSQIIVDIKAREGQWTTPPNREVIVEVVGVGEQRFPDTGIARQLKFN
ncbi:glycoside hydrolase family 31 protein [Gloeocapsa sp. PCC 73106]|uniref:glycoside hydrolase family 31 protein n=1 Tax=Gloeocapsa sp. PCC 73106 TaxID=102232 RepID=UPI0002ABC8A8|nr:glycoside hydrolase family 31 protein [Gloeocapsa sp. PCC 73106]ELR98242.1 family 31 glycosyl hydrolase, alpha-glucosidase [Gloeocapsa sp. PCC 73106]